MALKTVRLDTKNVTSGLNCLADPCFIVEMNGSYYLALAVLEYDEAQAGGNHTKIDGVHHVRRLFDEGYRDQPLKACPINSNGTLPSRGSNGERATARLAATSQASVTASVQKQRPGMPKKPSIPGSLRPPQPQAPPPSNFSSEPPGMQTEPPGMQTEPPE